MVSFPDLLATCGPMRRNPHSLRMGSILRTKEKFKVLMAAPGDTRTHIVQNYDDALAYAREVKVALGPRSLDFLIHLDNYMQERIDPLKFVIEIVELLEDHPHLVSAIPEAIAVMEDLDKIAMDQIQAVLAPDLFPVIQRSSQEIASGISSGFQMGSTSVPGVSPSDNAPGLLSNVPGQASNSGMEFLNSSENPFYGAHMQLNTLSNTRNLLQQQMNSQLMEPMSVQGNFGPDQMNYLDLASNVGKEIPGSMSAAMQQNMSHPLQLNAMANMGLPNISGTNFNVNPQTQLQPQQWQEQQWLQQQQQLQLQQQQQQQQLQQLQLNSDLQMNSQLMGPMSGQGTFRSFQMNLGSASNFTTGIRPDGSMSVSVQQNMSHPLQLIAMANMGLPNISGTNSHLNPRKQLQLKQKQRVQQQLQQQQQQSHPQQMQQQRLQKLRHDFTLMCSVHEALGVERFGELCSLLEAYYSKRIEFETVSEGLNQLLKGHDEILSAISSMIANAR